MTTETRHVSAGRTARERARAEVHGEILAAARRQMAEHGAAALSLRAVAREIGMVSSALYRYFPTRDDLLTALIVQSYDDLGETVEAAAAPRSGRTPRRRFLAAAHAIRDWSTAHPHEHALLFGSPVPGYAANPEVTNRPGTRVPLALLAILADAGTKPDDLPRVLTAQAAELGAQVAPVLGRDDIPAEVLVRGVLAWTALFGLIGFERTGQLRGSFEPADALFDYAVARIADQAGLTA